jgi:hypothetical protein
MTKNDPSKRVFCGVYPCGLSYVDRAVERHGDYKRLAFLLYRSLILDVERDCPPELAAWIKQDAAKVQARRGEPFEVSTCGQTVRLGVQP